MLDTHLVKNKIRKYKNLYIISRLICKKNPLQEKRIIKIFLDQNNQYFSDSEKICKEIIFLKNKLRLKLLDIANFYNNFCFETIKEQIFLKKNKTYRAIYEKNNNLALYSSEKKMIEYMIALMLTQVFWKSHVKIIHWYKNNVKNFRIKNFLEIGAGHGLLAKILLSKEVVKEADICDISGLSIKFSKYTLRKEIIKKNVNFIRKDFFSLKIKKKYDFIIMGEVIEHVVNPNKFLKKAKLLLRKNGKVFISTCANCAQKDHLYHFKKISEIRSLLKKNSFRIESEFVSPSEDICEKFWQKEMIAINYCAILS
jgi:2-polyprenyl-3-methyl-5-hydroxy-6-metoxy-1,4-benzoquinol methylase